MRALWCSMLTLLELRRDYHDDAIKWKHFPRNWPFVRRIHRSPVNSTHKGQWHGALMFSLICVWINDWVNNREAGELRRYRIHYDVIVMIFWENQISTTTSDSLAHQINSADQGVAVMTAFYSSMFGFDTRFKFPLSTIYLQKNNGEIDRN